MKNLPLKVEGSALQFVKTHGAQALKLVLPSGRIFCYANDEAHARGIIKSFESIARSKGSLQP